MDKVRDVKEQLEVEMKEDLMQFMESDKQFLLLFLTASESDEKDYFPCYFGNLNMFVDSYLSHEFLDSFEKFKYSLNPFESIKLDLIEYLKSLI